MRDLITEAYLQKASNGRLSLNRALILAEPVAPRVTKPTLPPDWRKIIARDVMLSSLRGATGFLREEATAQRYGVSRTVVWQVFNHLVGKGFWEHVPRAGWRVRRFDEADMCAYLAVREVVELKALTLAQPHLVRADLESMLAGNPIPATGQPIQLDNRLHAYLIEKAGNFYLRDFFERHGEHYMLLFEQAALEAKVVAEMAEQHRAILQALIVKDWGGAQQALVHHIRSQRPVMHKLLAEMVVERERKGGMDGMTAQASSAVPSRGKKRPKSGLRRQELFAGYLFLLPNLLGFLTFSVFPILAALYLTFTDWDLGGTPELVGFDNFVRTVRDDIFWKAIFNTFYTAIAHR